MSGPQPSFDGSAARVVAVVMVHNEIIADGESSSGKYAKLKASSNALELLQGLAPFEYRMQYRCDCSDEASEVTDEIEERKGFDIDVRVQIYEELLVTPSLPPYVGDRTRGENGSRFFNVNVLAASKRIHDEAAQTLYGGNVFRTLYYDARTFTDLGEYMDHGSTLALEEKLAELQRERDVQQSSEASSDSVCNDIAHLFDDGGEMAAWLSDLTFPLFLRTIGPDNTARIQTFQLDLGSLPTARDRLSIYTQIVREHMPGLRRIVVAFANVGDYGDAAKFGSYSYDECGIDLSWAEREALTGESLAGMLEALLDIFEDVPPLTRLEVVEGGEFLDVMAGVVMDVKCTGFGLQVSLNTVRRRYVQMKAAQAEALLGIPAWQWRQWMARNLTWQDVIPAARDSY
ncbi:MAG: hypothetical protein Q9187_009099 [Circinaria calcarea]